MVSAIRQELPMDATPTIFDKANLLACEFAARAAQHDRDASFPFENFDRLSEAGLLALTVPAALGGTGAGALDAARIIGIFAKADPSTALVLSMHYIQHLVMARSVRWPGRLARKLARETVEGVALINALRVEPDLGSPSRGGLPATVVRKTETGWRLSGRKIYSTGAPILNDVAAWIDCRIYKQIEAGDHWLVLGEVMELSLHREGGALVFHGGQFHPLT